MSVIQHVQWRNRIVLVLANSCENGHVTQLTAAKLNVALWADNVSNKQVWKYGLRTLVWHAIVNKFFRQQNYIFGNDNNIAKAPLATITADI